MTSRTYKTLETVYHWLLLLVGVPSLTVIIDMWTDAITPHPRDELSYQLLSLSYWGVGVCFAISLLYYITYKHHTKTTK